MVQKIVRQQPAAFHALNARIPKEKARRLFLRAQREVPGALPGLQRFRSRPCIRVPSGRGESRDTSRSALTCRRRITHSPEEENICSYVRMKIKVRMEFHMSGVTYAMSTIPLALQLCFA